jgi:hypothetical protein
MRYLRNIAIASIIAVLIAGLGFTLANRALADDLFGGRYTCPYLGQNAEGARPYGMMGGWPGRGRINPDPGHDAPLTVAEAESAVEDYVADLGADIGDEHLEIAEVMVFDNHAYVEVAEADTGYGAMELLVAPGTLYVSPEPGPNMMWNEKYGHMGDWGHGGWGHGGMMGGPGWGRGRGYTDPAEMPVTPDQAIEIAQDYLDDYQPGGHAGEEAETFYGYYTIHVLRRGEISGMLSVNGHTGQVFYHTWHGTFVTMSEGHESH